MRSVKIEVGDVVVETERERHRDRLGSLLNQLLHPRLLRGPLSFPLELRIDRHELRLDVAGTDHVFEAFTLDDKVVAHAEIEGAHIVVECGRRLWDEIRLEWLDRDGITEALAAF